VILHGHSGPQYQGKQLQLQIEQQRQIQSMSLTNKPFFPSSVPTVEVNVVASDQGTDSLGVTSRSLEKNSLNNRYHYRSIFEENKGNLETNFSDLQSKAKMFRNINTDSSISDSESEDEICNEDIGREDDDREKTNKPYDSHINERRGLEGSKHHSKISLVQSIPVLTMKKKQIPFLDKMSSISPSRYESLVPPKTLDINTLETPVNRSKMFPRKNCNSDLAGSNFSQDLFKKESM